MTGSDDTNKPMKAPRQITLTRAEIESALWAIGQHTHSNACDIEEMMSEGLSRNGAKALLRVDDKLRNAGSYKRITKASKDATLADK